jgi:hypothetical protein
MIKTQFAASKVQVFPLPLAECKGLHLGAELKFCAALKFSQEQGQVTDSKTLWSKQVKGF